MTSELERALAFQMKAAGVPEPVAEYQPILSRGWRVDFAWPGRLVAVEVEGGTWKGGRHVRAAGFEKDCLKYNELSLAGWKLLRFTAAMVEDGRALGYVERALGR